MAKKTNIRIAPTILTASPDEFQAALVAINEFTNQVQIDITDGEFAPSRTIGLDHVFWPDNWQVDLHMMVKNPSRYIDKLILMKPHLVIFHAEVEEDLRPSFEKLRQAGIKVGLALLRQTVPEQKADLITLVDHVLIFAGNLGRMGGQANLLQIQKVRLIRAISPNVEIGWDGGANIDNLPMIIQAGVDVINVGSAISLASNPAEAYKAMVELTTREGLI
jgi:ribulose-phosphate 3-epimerase